MTFKGKMYYNGMRISVFKGSAANVKIKELFIGDTSHTGIQFFRSLFVGGIATVVDMLIMILFRELVHVPEGIAAIFERM